jgi:simple sugar transport system permease protein
MKGGPRMLVCVVALYALLAPLQRGWLSARTPADLLNGGAVLGLCALGETLVVVAGGVDLSVAALAAFTSVVVASAVGAGVPAGLALACAPALAGSSARSPAS